MTKRQKIHISAQLPSDSSSGDGYISLKSAIIYNGDEDVADDDDEDVDDDDDDDDGEEEEKRRRCDEKIMAIVNQWSQYLTTSKAQSMTHSLWR
ncbi:hypothetical protein PoB_006875200 [Plakobranchus ocellatus]|uniref:Uncharacterized protein n=1 Tax=Plakobranchus ocellatus TaxID=259542 RepID=A0AAV4DDY1_9GAST|nr:hypothetical protein PoB_006875200 [Plakobranchus ocellatus]